MLSLIGRVLGTIVVVVCWVLCPIAWCFTGPLMVDLLHGLEEDE